VLVWETDWANSEPIVEDEESEEIEDNEESKAGYESNDLDDDPMEENLVYVDKNMRAMHKKDNLKL